MAVDLHRLVSPSQWPIPPYPADGALHALLSNGSSDWNFWDAGVYERHPLHTTGEPLRFSHIFRAHALDDVVAEGQSIIVDGVDTRPVSMKNHHDITMLKRVRREDEWWTGKWGEAGAAVGVDMMRGLFTAGSFSVLVREMQDRVGAIGQLVSTLEAETRSPCNANLYMTPRDSQGFELHFDWMENIIIQLDGEKTWKLYPPLLKLPRKGLKFRPGKTAVAALPPPVTLTLKAGDALYIPRGVLHEAEVTPAWERSMHLTLGILLNDLTYEGLLHYALSPYASDLRLTKVLNAALRGAACLEGGEPLRSALPVRALIGAEGGEDGVSALNGGHADAIRALKPHLSSPSTALWTACDFSAKAAQSENDSNDLYILEPSLFNFLCLGKAEGAGGQGGALSVPEWEELRRTLVEQLPAALRQLRADNDANIERRQKLRQQRLERLRKGKDEV